MIIIFTVILDLVQTFNFSCAKPDTNELGQMILLIWTCLAHMKSSTFEPCLLVVCFLCYSMHVIVACLYVDYINENVGRLFK